MKLELWYPVKPYMCFQKFGENMACEELSTGRVFNRTADVCPSGSVGLYASLGMKGHNGEDLMANDGQPVYASHEGIVVAAYADVNSGNTVGIKTLEQFDYGSGLSYFKTLYCHFQRFNVQIGNQVKAGDVIGFADSTGKSSGTHVHFGLKPVYQNEIDGTLANSEQNNGFYGAIDPSSYWNGFYAEDSAKVIEILNLELTDAQKVVELLKQLKNQ